LERAWVKPVLRIALPAVLLSLAALPMRVALAADFPAQCLEGGGGMFSKEECARLDDNVEDDDRNAMVALFKAALKAKEAGKELDDSTPTFQNGIAAIQKYEKKCSKK
jgi:hypothetical protein